MSFMGGRSTSFSFGQPSGGAAASSFGAPSAQTSNNASGPSFSFGGSGAANTNSNAQQPQQQQQQQQQQPGLGSSLFSFGGGQQNNKAPQQQQQPNTGGLFGTAQQQQKPPALSLTGQQSNTTGFGSSLFGQPQQQQQQPTTGGGLFGNSTAGPSSTASKGLFGGFGQSQQPAQQQQQPGQQSGGLFGTSTQQTSGPSNILGQSSLSGFQQGNTAIAANNQASSERPLYQKERFNDLSPEHKKILEQMDAHISQQLGIKDDLKAHEYGQEVKRRAAEWNELHNGVNDTLLILQQDGDLIRGIVDNVERDRTDLATLYDIARNYKEGKGDGKQWLAWPGEFFTKAAVAFRQRIKRYRSTIEEIERQLATIDTRNEHSPQLISDAIVHQHAIFMSLAANVASLHAEVDQLKRDYVQWYQQQYRSVRDPFAMSQLTATI